MLNRTTLSALAVLGALAASSSIIATPAQAALSCRDAVAFKVVSGKVYGLVRVQSGTRGAVYAHIPCSLRDRT